jgi:hypothetical protein
MTVDLLYVSKEDELLLAEGVNGVYNIFDSTSKIVQEGTSLDGYKIECDFNQVFDKCVKG